MLNNKKQFYTENNTNYNKPFLQRNNKTLINFQKFHQTTNRQFQIKKRQPNQQICFPNLFHIQPGQQSNYEIIQPTQNRKHRNRTTNKFLPKVNRTGIDHDDIKLNDFKQLHKIGQGSYSTVKLFLHNDKKYACKIFKKPLLGQILENVRSQITFLKRLKHKNIIKLHYTFEDTNHLYIVLDYIQGKTLNGYLKKNHTEIEIKSIFKQLVDAINCLHQNKIVHRDIKLDNVMIDDYNNVVLIDFGFSSTCQKKLKMFCGTPSYMSPQIVRRGWYSGIKADIWALGIILYKMLSGKFPFKGQNELQVFGKICNSKIEQLKQYSSQVNRLLRGLLNKNEQNRWNTKQILESKWFLEKCINC